MSCLHIVNCALGEQELQRINNSFAKGDCLILIEDACYNLSGRPSHKLIQNAYILTIDAKVRGVSLDQNHPNQVKDYDDFVALTLQFDKTLTWSFN